MLSTIGAIVAIVIVVTLIGFMIYDCVTSEDVLM